MNAQKQPSNLELQALSVLWNEGPSTVGTVLQNMPDRRERAYTTVLSVLQAMEKKGLVKRKKQGKAHVYSPAKAQDTIIDGVLKNFVRDNFNNSIGEAISSILRVGKLTESEKQEVSKAVKAAKTIKARKKVKLATAKAKPAKEPTKVEIATKKRALKNAKKAATKKRVPKAAAKKAIKKPVKNASKKSAKKAKNTVKKSAKRAS